MRSSTRRVEVRGAASESGACSRGRAAWAEVRAMLRRCQRHRRRGSRRESTRSKSSQPLSARSYEVPGVLSTTTSPSERELDRTPPDPRRWIHKTARRECQRARVGDKASPCVLIACLLAHGVGRGFHQPAPQPLRPAQRGRASHPRARRLRKRPSPRTAQTSIPLERRHRDDRRCRARSGPWSRRTMGRPCGTTAWPTTRPSRSAVTGRAAKRRSGPRDSPSRRRAEPPAAA